MPDEETFDILVRHAMLRADPTVIDSLMGGATTAESVHAGIRAGLRVLFDNGLITAVDRDQWPQYVEW